VGNTTIDINGKRYDAHSGALLGEGAMPKTTSAKSVARQGRVVDGFVHPHKMNTSVNQITQKQVDAQIAAKKAQLAALKAKRAASTKQAKILAAHKPQAAQTLMRHVVKKPVITPKKSLKVQAPKEMAIAVKPGTATPSHKLAAHTVDNRRLTRARSTRQSQHIQRFSTLQQNHPTAQQVSSVPVAVTAKPAQPIRQAQANQPASQVPVRRSVATVNHRAQQGDIRRAYAVANNSRQVVKTSVAQPANIFEAALANARSHEQPAHKPRKKAGQRLIQMASFVAAFVAIAGFVAYLNMPNIELRVASAKAGFSAQLPDYKPTGYALDGGVRANNGVVSVSFRSGTSKFTLQQQQSKWDSRTLLDNVVAMQSDTHKTYQSQGRTVYIYGNNAAWVNGGVLYSMQITGDMTHQEIVAVASSI
jgi:hypothetical protein